jgi:hypothetical protein
MTEPDKLLGWLGIEGGRQVEYSYSRRILRQVLDKELACERPNQLGFFCRRVLLRLTDCPSPCGGPCQFHALCLYRDGGITDDTHT